ncbi:fatty acid oxidation complex subunit alpha FadJ [Gracilimonas amylolytica]|uniref:fatty acid oxidation complex subunit alpha FadJ n=1 Tax=Gracilimonas amylolytica TaxID=1749045 RepID=UPI000CD8147C|nr:fatty acid oxidation complex subunit alpha FadJ [Gracilimonas amylolytica]
MSYLNISHKDSVAIITLDLPGEKVNKLNETMMDEFSSFLDKLETDNDLKGAVLISGKKDNFIAGADIDMFQARETAEEIEQLSKDGHKILNRIAEFKKPIAVAVHGSCMGGGLELSLACHYRVCSRSSKTVFALPEVKLGLLPGTGGTQRLPRLIGLQKALTYMLTGKNMYTRQAKKMGLVDEVTHKDAIEEAAIKGVQKIADGKFKRDDKCSFVEKLLEGNPLGRKIIFSQARKKTAGQTKGNYPAPPKIIDAVEYGYKHGLKNGLENETVLFGELGATQESRNLVNLFFGMNASKKVPNPDLVKPVKKLAVLGAGLMGSGIADVSINKGDYQVLLKDQSIEKAAEGEKSIWKDLNEKAKKKIISEFERDQIASKVTGVDSYDGFKSVDLVIEAVFEDLELKQNIVQQVESATGENCIFASNTSSLPITDIAKGASRPENIIGMHYFSPVQKMPLLEIITTDQTADWVTQTAIQVGVKQGKNVIVVQDGPGFYTTRILAPYMNEALKLLEEGASIEYLDKIMKDWGFPVGPMALFDEVGIDVGAHVAETMSPMFAKRGVDTKNKAQDLLDAGLMGRKNKLGMYRYTDGKKKEVNSDVYKQFGGSQRNDPDKETAQQRIALTMINEAVWCLQEDILSSPTDGDLGAILGLGFPPFLGGPFRYIDQTGVQNIVDTLKAFTEKYGPRFKPAPLLEDMAKNGESFFCE